MDSYKAFAAPHILTPSLSNRSNFAVGSGDLFVTGTAGVTSIIPRADVPFDIRFLLGVLNSSLVSFFAVRHSPIFSGGYYKFSAPYLKKLPIAILDLSKKTEKKAHDRLVELVDQIHSLHADLAKAKAGHAQTVLQRQIEGTDRQIDQLVYQLYGLTDAEIALVEAAAT